MKILRFSAWRLALAATTILAGGTLSAQAAARLLPFQGRLSDANGAAVPDGARVVQFKIYDAPVGGRAVWNGEVQKLTINAGLVSTILGTKASLSGVDFNQDLYLEITIDANGDGQISLADPPLLPRQSILPAVFAYESGNSSFLKGYDWSPLFGTNNPADGTLLSSKIADNAITTARIAAAAVTPSKLDTNGALAGQSLTFNGTNVVWSQVNALNAKTLNGYDWASIFNAGDPTAGGMSVASLTSRGSAYVNADLNVGGRTFLNGPSTTVQGSLTAVNITSTTDVTAFRDMWARSFNLTSDRNAKENFAPLDAQDVLEKVLSLPVSLWNYKSESKDAKHIGPVAQDFQAAFQLNRDDRHISIGDEGGVALAAIQGLNKKMQEGTSELRALLRTQQEQLEAFKAEIAELKHADK